MRWPVWGEAVMVGGVGRRCLWWADVKWVRVFGRCNAVLCARHVVCVLLRVWQGSMEPMDLFGMGKEV
jgi:hypothetical protein